ncbi:CHAD domain-containing protein, partial [Streptomyces rimosus]
ADEGVPAAEVFALGAPRPALPPLPALPETPGQPPTLDTEAEPEPHLDVDAVEFLAQAAATEAHRRLAEAVAALPLARAGHPYNADALTSDARQDAPWHQVRILARLSRYAQEVLDPDDIDPRLAEAGRALERHRDAAEAAAAAAAAARTPRIAPATAYALGVLHADQRHEVEAARFAFGRAWIPVPVPEAAQPVRKG